MARFVLAQGGDPSLWHWIAVGNDSNPRKLPALCGGLPRYHEASSTRWPWEPLPRPRAYDAAVLCPACARALSVALNPAPEPSHAR